MFSEAEFPSPLEQSVIERIESIVSSGIEIIGGCGVISPQVKRTSLPDMVAVRLPGDNFPGPSLHLAIDPEASYGWLIERGGKLELHPEPVENILADRGCRVIEANPGSIVIGLEVKGGELVLKRSHQVTGSDFPTGWKLSWD